MADSTQTSGVASGQPIGKVMVVTGTVKAVAPDGTERVLTPNSPVYANETIVTGSDGSVSLVFNDAGHTQLDLGRMSEVTLDHDVYSGEAPASTADVSAEVEQIQQALASGEFDPTTQLEAAAAGVVAGATTDGGGHPTVVFELTAAEVLPDSGAETTGPNLGFLASQEEEVPPAPEPAAPAEPPTAGAYEEKVMEGYVSPGELRFVSGDVLPDETAGARVSIIHIDGVGDFEVPSGGSISYVNPETGGRLTISSNGNYIYFAPPHANHNLDINHDGIPDPVDELFTYTVTNSAGLSATSTLTIHITDTAPTGNEQTESITEGQSTTITIADPEPPKRRPARACG